MSPKIPKSIWLFMHKFNLLFDFQFLYASFLSSQPSPYTKGFDIFKINSVSCLHIGHRCRAYFSTHLCTRISSKSPSFSGQIVRKNVGLEFLYPPLQRRWKGDTGFTLSVCPSVDRIVSPLYLQQYSSDPLRICTYQATSEGVNLVSKLKKRNFGKFFEFVTLSYFD